MGFRFRYGALLSYRQHLKEKAEIEFATAQRRLRETKESLDRHIAVFHETRRALDARLKEKIHSDELRNYHEYLTNLKDRIDALTRLVAQGEEVVRKKREDLLTRAKQHKVMEKLKERDVERWTQAQSQIEKKRMNEVAIVRYGRDFL